MKTCKSCSNSKSLSDYYKGAAKCKECTKKHVLEYRNNNLEKIRRYDKQRSILPHRVELKETVFKKYKNEFPERRKANNAVNNAVRDGRLEKWPCMVCGNPKSVGHHADYSRPLDVVWLCQAHHKQAHALVKDK